METILIEVLVIPLIAWLTQFVKERANVDGKVVVVILSLVGGILYNFFVANHGSTISLDNLPQHWGTIMGFSMTFYNFFLKKGLTKSSKK